MSFVPLFIYLFIIRENIESIQVYEIKSKFTKVLNENKKVLSKYLFDIDDLCILLFIKRTG